MTIIATAWLFLSVVLCALAWMAGRKLAAILLPLCVILAAFAVYLPLGKPTPIGPGPGEYVVVGADIQVGVAIFALLKAGDREPVYYKLPYTTEAANQLQAAKDAAAGGGPGVKVKIDGEGGQSYDGPPPVTGEPPKQAETPAVTLP